MRHNRTHELGQDHDVQLHLQHEGGGDGLCVQHQQVQHRRVRCARRASYQHQHLYPGRQTGVCQLGYRERLVGSGRHVAVGRTLHELGRNGALHVLIHVLRCFDNPALPHEEGSIDPVRDIEIVDFELQCKDLEQIERKISKVEKAAKIGDKNAKHDYEVLKKYKEHLEGFQNVRTLEVTADEKAVVADMMLLTEKPVLFVCNVNDSDAVSGNAYSEAVKKYVEENGGEMLVIAAKIESEIAELESEEDREVFLADVGLTEPGVNKVIRAAYKMLDLISFFTVGGKENRAWTITRGMLAPQAAGVIHSDLERGFIRAEVIKYDDLVKYGSELKCKEAGKLAVEGKNYEVQDGDILHIRFNV